MKNFGEFFNNQIQYAGNIVLSRTDIADHDKVEAAVAMIRELNDKASIITTPLDQLTGAQLGNYRKAGYHDGGSDGRGAGAVS